MNFTLRWDERITIVLARLFIFFKSYISTLKFFFNAADSKKDKINIILQLLSCYRIYRFLKIYILCQLINFESNTLNRKQLSNRLNRAVKFIEYPRESNNESSGIDPYVMINGWMLLENRFLEEDKLRKFQNAKFGIKRRDVEKIHGRRNLYSGFSLIFKSSDFSMDKLELVNLNAKLGMANPQIEKFLNNINFSKPNSKEIKGFIDETKYLSWANIQTKFIDLSLLVNLSARNKLDLPFRLLHEGVIGEFLSKQISTNYQVLNFCHVNKRVIQKASKQLNFPKYLEFFPYRVQNDVSPKIKNLENVRLIRGKYAINSNGFLENELAQSLDSDLIAGVNFQLFYDSENSSTTGCFNEPRYIVEIEKAIVLPSLVNSNWFHFFTESLAVLVWFKNMLPKNYPIVINEEIPSSIIQCLEFFGYINIIRLPADVEVKFEKLITFSKSTIIIDSIENLNDFQINSELILNLKNVISQSIKLDNPSNNNPISYVLTRKDKLRSLKLSKKSWRKIRKMGFELVFIENYSFVDQVKLISSADNLIVVGGAGLVNLIFAKPSAKIIYLTSDKLINYKLPKYFASIFGLEIEVITGRIQLSRFLQVENKYDIFHSDYYLSSRKVKYILGYYNNLK
jgi:hypothetical protein